MSSDFLAALLPQQPDPKQIQPVKALAEKTRSNRLIWEKQPSAITAAIPPHLVMNFVIAPYVIGPLMPGLRPKWKLFTVRNQAGQKLVDVENPDLNLTGLFNPARQPSSGSVPTPTPSDALKSAVDDLYWVVSEQAEGDLEKALNVINNL
jgi:hypothetical protein